MAELMEYGVMKVLVMAASLRQGSLNKKLAALAARELEAQGVEAKLVQFNDFDMPHYDFDIQQRAFPDAADRLKAAIMDVDAVVFAVPEYNYSIPGAFKNAIDWLSRYKNPNPLTGKPVLLLGASPGLVGANRGLWQTRIPIEAQLAYVYPDMFGVANAHEAFDDDGKLKHEEMDKKLVKLLESFVAWSGKLGG